MNKYLLSGLLPKKVLFFSNLLNLTQGNECQMPLNEYNLIRLLHQDLCEDYFSTGDCSLTFSNFIVQGTL